MVKKSPNPTDVFVGGRIRQIRIARHMTQTQLGEACGITFQQVQKYEKGANRVGASRLQQIAGVLGTEPSAFFPAKDINNNIPQFEDFTLKLTSTSVGRDLVEAAAKIKDQKLLRNVAAVLQRLVETQGGRRGG